MTLTRSVLLFILAAIAEIGGAWMVWQAVREGRSWWWAGLGIVALGLYGFVATLQPEAHFGRILAAYGGVFVAGSLAWGVIFDGFKPDRWDLAGSLICLVGVAVIMFAPRGSGAGEAVAVPAGRPRRRWSGAGPEDRTDGTGRAKWQG